MNTASTAGYTAQGALVTCRSCGHWAPVDAARPNALGRCAPNAWGASWTPGIGYGFSPFPDYERRCSTWCAS